MKLFFPILLTSLAVCSGCARSPERQYFTLKTTPSIGKESEVSFPETSITMGAVTIPDSVDRNKIVTRQPNSLRIEISEINRWSEPLNSEIASLLADDLRHKLPRTLVTTSGQNSGASVPEHRLDVDITRFDGTLGSGVVIEADWAIRDRKKADVRHGHAVIHEQTHAGDYDALVRAYAEGVHRLADLIGKSLQDNLKASRD